MTPQSFVTSGEVELAVYAWGTPAPKKPVVIMVHGYPDSASVWARCAEALAPKYYVVAYDVRGAGRSTTPDHTRAYALDHLVSDLAAVVDAISPDAPVHLLCHDWGSIQSWEAVCTERMKGRIASYTSISGPSIDHASYWFAQRLRSGSPSDLAMVARQLSHSWYIGAFQLPGLGESIWKLGLDKLWPKILDKVDGIADAEPSRTQSGDGASGVRLYRANFINRLLKPSQRHTDTPVQLIVPSRDRFMVKEIWDDLSQWVPNLWRREIHAGHWVQISHPQRVAQMTSEFIDMVVHGGESPALSRVRQLGARRPMSGKLVLVTGAGSGIGRETLLAFAEQGASVIAIDINLEAAERSCELARLLETTAWARKVDVGETDQMEALAVWVQNEFGTPDVVVNNAGIGMAGSILQTSTEDWERVLRVNLWSVIQGSRLFARQMIDAGISGHIINVSSALAFAPTRALPAYATSKAAVLMLSNCLRAELADHGIRVVSVCPGVVDTAITGNTKFVGTNSDEQAAHQSAAAKLYARRSLKPNAVAEAILDAVRTGRSEILVGTEARLARLGSRYFPGLMQRLAGIQLPKPAMAEPSIAFENPDRTGPETSKSGSQTGYKHEAAS